MHVKNNDMSIRRTFLMSLLILVGSLLMLSPRISFAQCDAIQGCSNWSNPIPTSISCGTCVFYFKYQTRTCPDGVQYRFIDITLRGPCADIEWEKYQYKRNADLELMIECFLDGPHPAPYCGGQPPTPNAPQYAYIYTAGCGVWLSCTYELNSENKTCDTDFPAPYPEFDDNGTKKITITKYQPCGDACCVRKYEVCRQFPSGRVQHRLLQGFPAKVGDCEDQADFDKPCQAGC